MASRYNNFNRERSRNSRGRPRERGSRTSNYFNTNSDRRFDNSFSCAGGQERRSFQNENTENVTNNNRDMNRRMISNRGNNLSRRGSKTPNDEGYLIRKPPLSTREIIDLLNKILEDDYSDNIALKLLDSNVRFWNFLNNEQNQNTEVIKIILKVIIKAGENVLTEENYRSLLTLVLRSNFATKRLDKVISIELPTNFDGEMLQLLIQYLKLNFQIIPGIAYDVFHNRVHNLNIIIESLQIRTSDISAEIIHEFQELKELANSNSLPPIPAKGVRRNQLPINDAEPPDNYKNISIFPTSQDLIEIATNEVFLRGNKSRGAYSSVDHYLDVQFRLMREDFIQPLREGLAAYKISDKKKRLNIRVYKNVFLLNSLPAERLGIIYNMQFDISKHKKVKWAQSKRFLYGSLLCLSADNFRTLLFCTIANRDIRDLENGVISVKFYECSPSKDEEYTLLETTNMFESYKHVLVKLQDTNEENLCMKKYLVYAENEIALPAYLARNRGLEYKFKEKRIWPGDSQSVWPRGIDLDMDESQYQAFKNALTKEITIIQGPPGTGKTYLGLNICECLIRNVQTKLIGFGPILVVCYTNHALDQFLEGISNFTDKIVRIGNRCKSEKLQQFSILNWKKKCPNRDFARQKWNIFGRLKELKDELIYKQAALKNSVEKLIPLDRLKIFIDEEQLKYLQTVGLKNWLYGESFEHNTLMSEGSVDTIIEWLMYEEIIQNVHQIVIDAQTEILNNMEENYDNDMDNEVNYINDQRRLDIDEDDIGNLNVEFNRAMVLLDDHEDPFLEDNDGFTLVKNKTTQRLFQNRLKSKKKMSPEDAAGLRALDYLSIEDRWNLYRFWRSKYTDFLHHASDNLEKEYDRLSNQINEIHFEEDRHVMKDQYIIGMTTTGAARYSKVLSLIRCKIIIVEEAAEVLESHIVGSLNPGCEHLILIGDHKQLKPNPAVYELAKRYELDISLFERLINNRLGYNTLHLQHRMRPEIADIMQFIYTDLQNHESVLNYPCVPSVSKNLYFFDHTEMEVTNDEIMSFSNPFEAEFIVKFCRHLMKNGIERTQMTILTLYSGQMFHLRKLMDKKIFDGVRVCVVDNYQGEENDIILLSLVRSNEYEKIGFLSIENRICVSLSRAKHGLYVFGNFQILANQNDMWKKICHFLKRRNMLSGDLQLLCQNHPEKRLTVSKACDFDKYPEGGCEELCNHRLNCGHACRKACHFLDKEHKNNRCMERCTRLCVNGHRCSLKCWQECPQCEKKVEKEIPICKHMQLMSCYKTPDVNDCRNKCERILECGHQCTRICKEKCGECLTEVDKVAFECGHVGKYSCCEVNITCSKPCQSVLGCEHRCKGSCGSCYSTRLHETCQDKCKALLVCGHACEANCSQYCPPCGKRCEEGCNHNACPNYCGEKCVSCFEKCVWRCKHKRCTKLCYELCDREVCDECCHKLLDCDLCRKRFQCYGLCGEPCRKKCLNCDPEVKEIFFGTEDEVDAKFVTLWTCGHSFEVNSMDNYMNVVADNGEIVTKKCPRCNTIINKRSCFRYLNIVKRISFDIKAVQKRVVDNLETFTYHEYQRKVNNRGTRMKRIFALYNIGNYFDHSEQIKLFLVPLFNTSLDLMYEIYERFYSVDRHSQYTETCIRNLIIWLNPIKRKFNEFELSQYNSEVDRIRMLVKLEARQKQHDHREILGFIEELKRAIFTDKVAEEFKDRWNVFEKEKMFLPNMNITEYERKEIVKALDLGKGRWFKCPKGHFYVIGECGGANEVSKCAECDSQIGGANHQLIMDNQFAPEMDHAEQPAWPGMHNPLL